MATRQMLGPLLRQALGHYLEVVEHELDLSGQLSLTAVKLRKQRAGPASVSGDVGCISARWSWSELLRQPVVLNVTDVNIQIWSDGVGRLRKSKSVSTFGGAWILRQAEAAASGSAGPHHQQLPHKHHRTRSSGWCFVQAFVGYCCQSR